MQCRSESEREAKAAATMLTCLISCSKGNATVITGTHCARTVYADLLCLVAVMIAIIIFMVTTTIMTIIITMTSFLSQYLTPLWNTWESIFILRRNLTRSVDIAFNAFTDMRYTVLTGKGSRRSDELHILRPFSHDSCTAHEYVHNKNVYILPWKYLQYFILLFLLSP